MRIAKVSRLSVSTITIYASCVMRKPHGPLNPRIPRFLRHDQWWSPLFAALLPCSASCLPWYVTRLQGPEIAMGYSFPFVSHTVYVAHYRLSKGLLEFRLEGLDGYNRFPVRLPTPLQLFLLQIVENHVARQGNPAPTKPAHLAFVCRGHGFLGSPVTDR